MPPTIEVTVHAMLRYVQRVDPKAVKSEIVERVRDSVPAGEWVLKGLAKRNNGKHAEKLDARLTDQLQIARRDRGNQCVYLVRVVSKEKWSVTTVLSQKQVAALKP